MMVLHVSVTLIVHGWLVWLRSRCFPSFFCYLSFPVFLRGIHVTVADETAGDQRVRLQGHRQRGACPGRGDRHGALHPRRAHAARG